MKSLKSVWRSCSFWGICSFLCILGAFIIPVNNGVPLIMVVLEVMAVVFWIRSMYICVKAPLCLKKIESNEIKDQNEPPLTPYRTSALKLVVDNMIATEEEEMSDDMFQKHLLDALIKLTWWQTEQTIEYYYAGSRMPWGVLLKFDKLLRDIYQKRSWLGTWSYIITLDEPARLQKHVQACVRTIRDAKEHAEAVAAKKRKLRAVRDVERLAAKQHKMPYSKR